MLFFVIKRALSSGVVPAGGAGYGRRGSARARDTQQQQHRTETVRASRARPVTGHRQRTALEAEALEQVDRKGARLIPPDAPVDSRRRKRGRTQSLRPQER